MITSKDCSEVVNACDAAREGELIFRRIVEFAKVKCPTTRMWLQSLTNDAIQSAWDNRASLLPTTNLYAMPQYLELKQIGLSE